MFAVIHLGFSNHEFSNARRGEKNAFMGSLWLIVVSLYFKETYVLSIWIQSRRMSLFFVFSHLLKCVLARRVRFLTFVRNG